MAKRNGSGDRSGDGLAELEIAPLTAYPPFIEVESEIAAHEERRVEALRRRASALARAAGAKSGRAVAERAKDLIAGGIIAAEPPLAVIAAAEEELAVLDGRLGELGRVREQVIGEFSRATCEAVRGARDEAMRQLYDAIWGVWEAVRAVYAVRSALYGAGCDGVDWRLPIVVPGPLLALGDPGDRFGTHAGAWRHWLQEERIIAAAPVKDGRYVDR